MRVYKSLIGLLIVASCVSGRGTVGTNAPKSVADLDHVTVFLRTAQSSDSELKKKIGAFRLALKKGILSESDWQLHDDLLKQYIKLKYGLRGTQLTLPAKSRIRVKLPSFCLNSGRAIPDEQEHFRWKKASPDIPYYKELIKQAAYAKNKGDYQSLLWNLQNKTHWEQYPENLKKIILGIDPKAPLKLPSDIKSKATSALSDLIESKLPVVSKAKEVLGSAKGTFQDLKDIQRQLEAISSSYPLTQRGDMPELVDGTELFATTQSQGYSSQEVTFYNPTNEEQSLDLTEYYLEPTRSDVQRIGLTGTGSDDDLFADLERVLFEDMLRLGIGFTPGINDAVDAYELLIGKDFLTGERLSFRERALSGLGLIVGSGVGYRFAQRAVEAPAPFLRNFEEGLEKASRKAIKIESAEAKTFLKKSELTLAERRRASKIRSYTAEEANLNHIHQKNPPYKNGTKVVEFKSVEGDKWVRLHGEKNQIRSWAVREEAIRGLSPNELKAKYSLPETPTHVSDVAPPIGTTVRRGRVAENFMGHQGATQYEFLDAPKESWFKNVRHINGK